MSRAFGGVRVTAWIGLVGMVGFETGTSSKGISREFDRVGVGAGVIGEAGSEQIDGAREDNVLVQGVEL